MTIRNNYLPASGLAKPLDFTIICLVDTLKGKTIAVIGGRKASDELLMEAETIGRQVAESGGIILTGGLGGIMEAASRGASNAGGMVLGILPGDNKNDANQYVSVTVASGLGIGRNVLIARTADALIAVGGAYGTLSEIAFALQLGKPVAGIETWTIEGVMLARNAANAIELISGQL
ncbi:TIGR00725 family protein [Nitrospirota bacterium]